MYLFKLEFTITLKPSRLRNPIFVAGLPGMGLTGKQAVDYLTEKLNSEKVGYIVAPYLSSPVVTSYDGIIEDIPEELYRLYFAETDDKQFLLFTGTTQPLSPEWQHQLAYTVVKAIKEFNPRIMYTFAATPIYTYKREANVYCVASRKDLLEELSLYGVIPMFGEGAISGVNGLLIGYGKKFGIDGVILLGETYLTGGRDYIAPLSILKAFSRIVNIKIDLSKLEELAAAFHREFTSYLAEKRKEEERREKLAYIS